MNPQRPNIVLIMSDQHHAGMMGCAGDPLMHTPAMDSLARNGVRFSNAYCGFPLCGPSRMAFMTCRHPHEIPCLDNECQFNSDIPTFAHAFLAGGYHTVLSGRMHFVGQDQRHGFMERTVGDVPESAYLAAGWKLNQVLDDLADTPGMALAGVVKSGPGRSGYHAYDETVTAATVDWLKQRAASAANDPFLLVVGYAAPHCPFVAPPEDFARYADRISIRDLPKPDPNLHPLNVSRRKSYGVDPTPPADAQWRTRVAYYGLCTFLDRQLQSVLDTLKATPFSDNTIVIYTSDHGEALGEHGFWWKSTFYEGSCHVPLIMSMPGARTAGTTVPQNVSLNDIGATLLDLAGLPGLPAASGRSFRCLLDGRPTEWPDTVWSENMSEHLPDMPRCVPGRMVRKGPWKYNYYHGLEPELFNLDSDPCEIRNRANDPDCCAIRESLQALALQGWDPETIRQQRIATQPYRKLQAAWINKVHPPEPDPLWFKTPPENHVDATLQPPS